MLPRHFLWRHFCKLYSPKNSENEWSFTLAAIWIHYSTIREISCFVKGSNFKKGSSNNIRILILCRNYVFQKSIRIFRTVTELKNWVPLHSVLYFSTAIYEMLRASESKSTVAYFTLCLFVCLFVCFVLVSHLRATNSAPIIIPFALPVRVFGLLSTCNNSGTEFSWS
jgi:hypothetical protein